MKNKIFAIFLVFLIVLVFLFAALAYFNTPETKNEQKNGGGRAELCAMVKTRDKSVVEIPEEIDFEEAPAEKDEECAPLFVSIGFFDITAYCSCEICCGEWADGITATGTEATQGRTIAVDPNTIPLGSSVYFVGQCGDFGEYIAEDIGGAIVGNRIDLYFDSHYEAIVWGVRRVEVFVAA